MTIVAAGKNSEVFRRRSAQAADASRCFSIRTARRTLDLEADSREQRDRWVELLTRRVESLRQENVARGRAVSAVPAGRAQALPGAQLLADERQRQAKHVRAGSTAVMMQLPSAADEEDNSVYNEAMRLLEGGAPARAVPLLREAARTGHGRAMYNLAVCLGRGDGVAADAAEALQWLEGAAARGIPEAHYDLALALLGGGGVRINVEAAIAHLEAAAEARNASAMFHLATYYEDQGFVGEAVRLYRDAAEQGHARSMTNLAAILQRGDEASGVASDLARAAQLYRRAADAGDAAAQFNLAVLLAEGNGVERDIPQALALYEKAAEAGVLDVSNAAACVPCVRAPNRDLPRAGGEQPGPLPSRGHRRARQPATRGAVVCPRRHEARPLCVLQTGHHVSDGRGRGAQCRQGPRAAAHGRAVGTRRGAMARRAGARARSRRGLRHGHSPQVARGGCGSRPRSRARAPARAARTMKTERDAVAQKKRSGMARSSSSNPGASHGCPSSPRT